MPVLALAAVRKQIQMATPDPVYLLQGEDEVEKSALASEFAALVDEDLRAFNVERFHAGDYTTGDKLADGVAALTAAARTLPMMAPRRVVMVLQADALFMPKRESEAANAALAGLESLLRDPEPQTILLFIGSGVDKRSRMYKLLLKQATIVECGAIEDQADLERWVKTRVAAAGGEIEPAATRLLVGRAGLNIKRLRGEVDRLMLYTLGQKRVTVEDARAIAGPSALVDDWAMTNAIEAGDPAEALRQLALMLDSGAPPEKILGQLGWLVRAKFPEIAPGDLRVAIEALFRTDQDLKRSAADPRILLERLIVELCAGAGDRVRRGRRDAW